MYKIITCADYELEGIIDQINKDMHDIVAVVEKGSTWRIFVKEKITITGNFPKWTDGTPDIPEPGSIVEVKAKPRGKK